MNSEFRRRWVDSSPRLAAGNVLPVTAVLRSTVRVTIDFQFAR